MEKSLMLRTYQNNAFLMEPHKKESALKIGRLFFVGHRKMRPVTFNEKA